MMKRGNRVIVVRDGLFEGEKWVRLVMTNGEVFRFDPCWELSQALGGWFCGRHSCILSFCDGLAAAGKEVIINSQFVGLEPERRVHFNRAKVRSGENASNPCWTVPAYYLLGIAWAKGQWPKLKAQLQQIPFPRLRQQIWKKTAMQWFEPGLKTGKHSVRVQLALSGGRWDWKRWQYYWPSWPMEIPLQLFSGPGEMLADAVRL